MAASYEQEQTQLEQAILRKLPKEVRKSACNLDVFIQQVNITPQNIISEAQKSIIQFDPDIQPLVETFNQRHPNNPYNPDTFGAPIKTPAKQALTTQFKHSVEVASMQGREEPSIADTSEPTPHKIKPK